MAQNRAAFLTQMRQQQARNLRQSLVKRLRSGAKIEVNQELFKPTAPQQQAGL